MKITVFNGSPRGRHSNSHRIVEPLLEGAREAGAETEEIFLMEKDIRQCMGCFTCWEKTPGVCALQDDMADLINRFLESDYAGMATPVYGMLMTGLMKNFTDRFLPLATPHIHRHEDGVFYHEGRVKRMPPQFFIANAGFPGGGNFDMLKAYYDIVKASGQPVVLEIYRNCGEALDVSNDTPPHLLENLKQFQEALKEAGREMATKGAVSEETVEQIHMKLISDEEYMAGANEYWDEQLDQS